MPMPMPREKPLSVVIVVNPHHLQLTAIPNQRLAMPIVALMLGIQQRLINAGNMKTSAVRPAPNAEARRHLAFAARDALRERCDGSAGKSVLIDFSNLAKLVSSSRNLALNLTLILSSPLVLYRAHRST